MRDWLVMRVCWDIDIRGLDILYRSSIAMSKGLVCSVLISLSRSSTY